MSPRHLHITKAVNGGIAKQAMAAMLAIASAGYSFAQEVSGWVPATVTQTDLLKNETKHGKFAYAYASVMTRDGCHVAKVEGEQGKEVFVRRDGKRGRPYQEIAAPIFSADGKALAYAARTDRGWLFVTNELEGPVFEEVMHDTFSYSGDGKRHAYLATKDGRVVAVIDGAVQRGDADGDMAPWLAAPLFSPDGSRVCYLEGSHVKKKMRAIVNGKPEELFDGVDPRSLRVSADGKRHSYGANDRGAAGNNWLCVIDGQRQAAFNALGVSYAFSPDGTRVAYSGRRGHQWFLAVEGDAEVPIEGIVDHSLTFSPDSRRLAYAVAMPDGRNSLVVDGKPGPIFDGIGGSLPPGVALNRASMQTGYGLGSASFILFSPDSSRLAYIARTGRAAKVYLDGNAENVEMDFLAGGIVFSSDSKHVAYGGRRGNKFFLVVDGKKGEDYDALGHFGFSPDGKHTALVAVRGKKNVIVVDGQVRGEYAVVPAGPVFRSDGVLEFLAADNGTLYRVEVGQAWGKTGDPKEH